MNAIRPMIFRLLHFTSCPDTVAADSVWKPSRCSTHSVDMLSLVYTEHDNTFYSPFVNSREELQIIFIDIFCFIPFLFIVCYCPNTPRGLLCTFYYTLISIIRFTLFLNGLNYSFHRRVYGFKSFFRFSFCFFCFFRFSGLHSAHDGNAFISLVVSKAMST